MKYPIIIEHPGSKQPGKFFRTLLRSNTVLFILQLILGLFILVLMHGCAGAANQTDERQIQFTVRVPAAVPVERRVQEIFPLRNYIFFDEAATEIPIRYVMLSKEDAVNFSEGNLQKVQTQTSPGRSARQMMIYYNILNIVGDRMRQKNATTISLTGVSPGRGAAEGRKRAESVKRYLVEIFGIDEVRVKTAGRDQPRIVSENTGETMPHDLVMEGDSRVEIESSSPMMMQQVGGSERSLLDPVQINALSKDPFGSYIFFTVLGAKTGLRSWSLVISDELGKELRVGPFTRDQITISGNRILDGRSTGEYSAVLNGITKNGTSIRKEHTFHLAQKKDSLAEATRFSVLFDFDRSQTAAGYDRFLVKTVAPLIPEYCTVIIHGHTDIIGDEVYNDNLSLERANDTKGLIEDAVRKTPKRGITFETFGFGSDPDYSPFDNYFPEQRFYNRTVIIDIIPD